MKKIPVSSPLGVQIKTRLRETLISSNRWKPGSYRRSKKALPFFEAAHKYLNVNTMWDNEQNTSVFVVEDDQAMLMLMLQLGDINDLV